MKQLIPFDVKSNNKIIDFSRNIYIYFGNGYNRIVFGIHDNKKNKNHRFYNKNNTLSDSNHLNSEKESNNINNNDDHDLNYKNKENNVFPKLKINKMGILLFFTILEEEQFITIIEDCTKNSFELAANIELGSHDDGMHQKDNIWKTTFICIEQIIVEIKKEYNDHNDVNDNYISEKYQDYEEYPRFPTKWKIFENGQNVCQPNNTNTSCYSSLGFGAHVSSCNTNKTTFNPIWSRSDRNPVDFGEHIVHTVSGNTQDRYRFYVLMGKQSCYENYFMMMDHIILFLFVMDQRIPYNV